ncbi:L-seryl-tRNA(Sec) selenium transferase [Brachybacterium endophyticum]|uniref:L-seryl-tRNA(Sec) selenium transferase n=1 Tax=Brachybacterium endophyticum TaxID=2182385 RepID=A0A2U2RLE0_9MICO|nr:L-seryl-tRNA(Sec) selenium transferase [Brachybacterium endophyticum]PWH06689.1 L-seryl-tRNA(Sec) selenium transferase [Brachybacterium endophyticum]
MAETDPRRRIPRTDRLLALPEVARASASMGERVVRELVRAVQDRARSGQISPEQVEQELLAGIGGAGAHSLRPVLNATGVIVHTNLGRAPLSAAARAALQDASGYTDVEFDLPSGQRSRRGAAARTALLEACPAAEDALIVNNGAAALLLATTALAGTGEVVLSRGEMIEIGAGFRLPDLVASTGTRIREIGTTNRTHADDYRAAIGPDTGAVLRIHASNYRISGFTSAVPVAELADVCHRADLPLVVDLGSGLLEPDPVLPEEPALGTALRDGADLVIASGDKLLGGPQAGILLGRAEVVARLARHPMSRAMRADKLALAALEATLRGPEPPVPAALHADPEALRTRTTALADQVGGQVVAHEGRVGGGGGAEVPLPGWALALPEHLAEPLRRGDPAVVGTVRDGACLLDLRCIPAAQDVDLARAVRAAQGAGAAQEDA